MVARIPGSLRGLSTSARVRLQHVLYFGDVLGYNSVQRFAKLPRAWIDAVGASGDIDHGIAFTHASGSPTHSMLSYTLLSTPLNPVPRREATLDPVTHHAEVVEEEEGEVIGEEPRRRIAQSKVFALGRNTHAQLGLGFASQEATRGMVTGDITGRGGISDVAAGAGFSFVVTASDGESNVYGFGNDTLGQLGASTQMEEARLDVYDVSTRLDGSSAPQLRLLPLPKRVPLDQGWTVRSIATGIDHTLLLVERHLAGHRVQEVLSTGLNTDGQLGVTPAKHADAVPIQPLISRTFTRIPLSVSDEMVQVVCGADTSYVLLRSGDLYAWGNSEYAQTLAGTHDRITTPTHIPNPLIDAYTSANLLFDASAPPTTKKIVAGGSFAVLLDSHHRIWIVGYGVGNATAAEKLTLVEGLPQGSVEDVWAGLEYVVATTREENGELKVWIWGVLPRSIATVPVTTPMQVPFKVPKSPKQQYLDENPNLKKHSTEEEGVGGNLKITAAACTRDHVIVVMDDGRGKHVWAECVQPPQDKGTDVV